jgi:hypothetical protein
MFKSAPTISEIPNLQLWDHLESTDTTYDTCCKENDNGSEPNSDGRYTSSSAFLSEDFDNPFDEWTKVLVDNLHCSFPSHHLHVLDLWDDPDLDLVSRQSPKSSDAFISPGEETSGLTLTSSTTSSLTSVNSAVPVQSSIRTQDSSMTTGRKRTRLVLEPTIDYEENGNSSSEDSPPPSRKQRGKSFNVDVIDDSIVWNEEAYQKLLNTPMSRIGKVLLIFLPS